MLTPINTLTTPELSTVKFYLYGDYRDYWLMEYKEIGGELCAQIRRLKPDGNPYSPTDSAEFSCLLTVYARLLYIDLEDVKIGEGSIH